MKERNEYDERFLNKLNNDFEEEITEIINKYPIMCVYDFIGSLVGMRDTIKTQLIEEASDFKPTSIEIEKRLTMELNVDRYIELSTLQRLYEKMQKRFEFRTVKDLKNELYPIKKITATAMDYNLNKYPISIPGLEAIMDTITFKKKTYNEFVRANTEEINYEKFEKSMLKMIGDELITQLKKGTSRFIYYIQNLVDLNGQSVFDFLNTYGISDLDALVHVSKIDTVPLLKTFEALTITKNDVMVLTKKPNIFDRLEDALNTLKKKNHVVTKKNIMELIVSQKPYEIEYMKETCKMVGETYEDVIKIYNKNHLLIDQFKIQDLVGGMSRLLLLFDFESIIQNLSRVIYYSILSNVCKQISRIIEVYIKINEDKSLFLLGIKKMQEVKSENDWVKIKIEELLIKRLMRRQSELAAVFNARE